MAQSLANVTPDDVRKAAAKYLAPERASLVIVGDAQYFLDDLKALRGEVEVIPFSELDLASADLRKAQAAGE